ncbi:unnamed protein product [Rhodiola kirilowii]
MMIGRGSGSLGTKGEELLKILPAKQNKGKSNKNGLVQVPSWPICDLLLVEHLGIVDCRFFTLLAVGGSLLGSILCFLEGCVVIVKSYMQYFHNMAHRSDQGHVVELLIEAIDMFRSSGSQPNFGPNIVHTECSRHKCETWFVRRCET